MKGLKKIFILPLLALVCLASCEETEEVGEFDNWEARNAQFVDSIAKVARANADGTWKCILDVRLNPDTVWSVNDYVYCQVIEEGTGTSHPVYTDSVRVNYRGRLMPSYPSYPEGYQFDSSFQGELNPAFNVPATFLLSSTVPGFYTAVQQMTDGDLWKVYIPNKLGYGASGSTGVPAYSTLVFDINLVSFSR
jgi:FKBP-type peptidyl-prolyl cis-trans isomerase FklB